MLRTLTTFASIAGLLLISESAAADDPIIFLRASTVTSAPNASEFQRKMDAETAKVMQDFLELELKRAIRCAQVLQETDLAQELARKRARQFAGEPVKGEDPRKGKLRAQSTPGPLGENPEKWVSADYLGTVQLSRLGDLGLLTVKILNNRKAAIVAMRQAQLPMDEPKVIAGILQQVAREVASELPLKNGCADYVVSIYSTVGNKDECTADSRVAMGEFKARIELRARDESRTVFSGAARFTPTGVWKYADYGEYKCRIMPRGPFVHARLYDGNRLHIEIPMGTDDWWCFKEGGEGGGPRGESFWWMTFTMLHAEDQVIEDDKNLWVDLSPREQGRHGTLHGHWPREVSGPCSSMWSDTSISLIPAGR